MDARALAQLIEEKKPGWLQRALEEPDRYFGRAGRDLGKPLDQAGRLLLLLESGADTARVEGLYHRGDNRERAAVLQALPWLPDPARFVPLAVEACRNNVHSVFEAIACDNPFPAAHFPEPAFNQLVLKCLFVGLRLSRVSGLASRVGGELIRMARDYAAERRAAGRPVPEDISLLEHLLENAPR